MNFNGSRNKGLAQNFEFNLKAKTQVLSVWFIVHLEYTAVMLIMSVIFEGEEQHFFRFKKKLRLIHFFSRNQLTVIPPFIKCLQALEVFLASHNKLVSLPEEIGELKRLMEIVSWL